jgi:hypothetical protein
LNLLVALTLALALSSAACNPFRRKKTPPPTPPAPAVHKPAPAAAVHPPSPEAAVQRPSPAPKPQEPPDTGVVRLPAPPSAQPAPPPRTRPSPMPGPAQAAPEPTPVPAPQLGVILSPSEQQRYSKITDQALSRAWTALRRLEGCRLTPEQKARLDRVLTFIRQAQEVRSKDLVQAASLAERAAVLAADLAGSVR